MGPRRYAWYRLEPFNGSNVVESSTKELVAGGERGEQSTGLGVRAKMPGSEVQNTSLTSLGNHGGHPSHCRLGRVCRTNLNQLFGHYKNGHTVVAGEIRVTDQDLVCLITDAVPDEVNRLEGFQLVFHFLDEIGDRQDGNTGRPESVLPVDGLRAEDDHDRQNSETENEDCNRLPHDSHTFRHIRVLKHPHAQGHFRVESDPRVTEQDITS